MKLACTLALALILAGCAYLRNEPYCAGADKYRGMISKDLSKLPTALKIAVDERLDDFTLAAWYQGSREGVVVVAVSGEDRELRYREADGHYELISEAVIPCLVE